MREHRPYESLANEEERRHWDKRRGWRKYRRGLEHARVFNESEHLCRKWHDDKPTDETAILLGKDMVIQNRAWEQQLWKGLDKSEDAKLTQWKLEKRCTGE